jgi:hypothetical protein
MPDCSGQPAAKELLIDRFWLGGEKTECDLRARTIMSNADQTATRVRNLHPIARLRIASIHHIARKNPGMPARNAVGGLSIYANSGQPAILA